MCSRPPPIATIGHWPHAARPDGGRLNRVVGVIAAQRRRTETEVVFAGIVVAPRIGFRVDEASATENAATFAGPVPGHRRTAPHVDVAMPSKRRRERQPAPYAKPLPVVRLPSFRHTPSR